MFSFADQYVFMKQIFIIYKSPCLLLNLNPKNSQIAGVWVVRVNRVKVAFSSNGKVQKLSNSLRTNTAINAIRPLLQIVD